MSSPEVVFHPDASAEYREAYLWYAQRSELLADRFESEVEEAVSRIAEAPDRWPAYDEVHRKLILRRFPYLLIYRHHGERVWIVAVAHGHRRPGNWRDRRLE